MDDNHRLPPPGKKQKTKLKVYGKFQQQWVIQFKRIITASKTGSEYTSFTKAFDAIDHQILLNDYYGVRGIALD